MSARGFILLWLAGCGTSIDPHDYKRSCAADSECVAVYGGDVCALCPCPTDGIAASDLPRYQKDTASLKSHCSKTTPPVDCEPCPAMLAFCLDGTCSIHPQ